MKTFISTQFVSARRTAHALPSFPGGELPSTAADAYQIQAHSIEAWPDSVAGWKVGGVAPQDRHLTGYDRLAGPIFRDTIRHASGKDVVVMPVFEGGFAAVEPEFILEIARDIDPGDNLDLSAAQIRDLVGSVYVGVEIASSPLATINALGPMCIISDFGNNAGLIVGQKIPNGAWARFSDIQVRAVCGDDIVGETPETGNAIDPIGSLSFLIELMALRNMRLPAGTLVSTGAITGVHDAEIGSQWRVEFDGYESIDIRLEPAETMAA